MLGRVKTNIRREPGAHGVIVGRADLNGSRDHHDGGEPGQATAAPDVANAVHHSEETRVSSPTSRAPIQGFVESPPTLARAVSVIIPAYQEAAHVCREILSVRDAMRTSGWAFEIIVVDDGSTDGTAQEAARVRDVRVIRSGRNRGYGAALKRGISEARHEWILITDADGTYPVSAIPTLLAAAPGNDMVVGARTGPNVQIPLARRPAKLFLERLASFLVGYRIRDVNSGLRLMRADLLRRYEHLLPSGFSFTTTMTVALACNDHDVAYVPIEYRKRQGESKVRARAVYDFALLIVRTIVMFNPLKVFLPLGALPALVGVTKLGYELYRQDVTETALLPLLMALIIWAIGLLADQNARIANRRP